MASHSCRACLRALRIRHSQLIQNPPVSSRTSSIYRPSVSVRNFSISSRFFASPQLKSTDGQAPVDPSAQGDLLKSAPTAISLAKQLRKRATGTTETYVAYGSTESLFKTCAEQADYDIPQVRERRGLAEKSAEGEDLGIGQGWWYSDLKLTPTFNTWAQVTFLHMYILTVRFRLFPAAQAPDWHQHLLDHFFFAAEQRMEQLHEMDARMVRSKYLKDLFIQWRGVLAAYDEGLVKGDAVLAAAVWRNIFKGSEDVKGVDLAMVVSYLRREVANVGRMSDEEIARGAITFADPNSEKSVVLMESHLMREVQ